jgi:PAS domain S-box-containing protein
VTQVNLDHVQVLLIDDDEDDFANIKGVLSEIERSKYNLSWESSYQAGLNSLVKKKYDICLLDFRLGEKTGLELLMEARSLGIATPIILLTGHGDFEIDVRAVQSGAADYLVKAQITAPLIERSIRYTMKHALDMRELEEQRESFKVLFNSTFEGIVVHREGQIVDANAAMERIFGFGLGEMLEKSLYDLFRSDFTAELKEVLKADTDVLTEAVGIKRDGSEIFLELTSRTILLKGQPISLLASRDISQRKQMETQILQQDRLASLGLLASSLAHEIGTPLGVIRGRAELIAKSGDEKTKGNMEIITKQIDRVTKLVNSLLHIARGGQSDFASDVNVVTVIQDVANLMSHELERRDIELKISTPHDLIVKSEAGPLGQVFLNLMVNSAHAIEEARTNGSTRRHWVSIEGAQNESSVVITVADSGCGISEANLRNLFKPFFTTKDIGIGTGLGLATSYKLLQSWGGTVSVESKENEGTIFKIVFPSRLNS